jgi:tetratricopeptide (TPR) repeat protein
MPSVAELLNEGQQHHRAGNLPEAEAIYRQVLQAAPGSADAWNLMGVLAHQVGRPETALECIRYALALDPAHTQAQQNLAAIESQLRAGQVQASARTAGTDLDMELWVGQASRIGMRQVKEEIVPLCRFLRQLQPNHVMEISPCYGGTFYLWTRLARGKKIVLALPPHLFAGQSERDATMRNYTLKRWAPQVFPLLADSRDRRTPGQIEKILAGDRLDFLFLDGNPAYEAVQHDYETYRRFVRPGGCIALSGIADSGNDEPSGVAQLWRELSGERIEFNIGQLGGGIGVLHTKD